MNVKRYEWVACDEHACHCDVVESAEGDMVDYEDYAALEARCTALAAENAGLKAAIIEHSQCFTVCKCCGTENDCSHDDVCRAVNEVHETDFYMAEVRATAIETCADDLVSRNNIGGHEIDAIYLYAAQLRKGVRS